MLAAPLAVAVDARIGELSATSPLTKAQKSELTKLKALSKRLGKRSSRLSHDFAELSAGAVAVSKLGAAGAPFADEVAEGIRRAGIELNEREDMVAERRALLSKPTDRTKVDKLSAAAAKKRAAALAATTDKLRAQRLVPAERAVTQALALAEKLAKRTGEDLPPARVRSGELIGLPGARLVIPRDSGTGVDGSWVLFAPGAFQSPSVVTIAEAASFVGDRNVPAGGAITVGPPGTTFNGQMTLSLVYALPDGADAADVVVFRDDAGGAQAVGTATLGSGSRVSAASAAVGTFQPGVQAPPLGAPDGRYVVQYLVTTASGGTTVPSPPYDPGFAVGVLTQELTFRRTGTGSAATGSLGAAGRLFQPTAPHHLDSGANSVFGGYEFAWTSPSEGRFQFQVPVFGTEFANAEGVASEDGNVLAITGHGAGFDFFGVALHLGSGVAPEHLAGRWAAVQLGVQMSDDDVEPFRTRWTGAARTFTAGTSGDLTFSAGGTVLEDVISYRTETADPVHLLSLTSAADGGTLQAVVQPDGSLSDFAGEIRGLYSPATGVLVISRNDRAAHTASLMVAARQPDTVPSSAFEGAWRLAQFGIGVTTGIPDARSSAHEVTTRVGTFDVGASLDANETLEPGKRAVYTLTGSAPITSMTWNLASATPPTQTSALLLTLAPDASGNHRPALGERWYSVSGDGSILLGFVPGNDEKSTLGIAVGVR